MRLFGKQITSYDKTPNPEKDFLHNYEDHLNYLLKKFSERFEKVGKGKKDPLEFLGEEIALHIDITERLRDGYDLFDEVLGATVVPTLAGLTALTTAALGIFEGVQDLAIHMKWMKAKDKVQIQEDFGTSDYFAFAAIALTIAVVSFANSVLSLVARPINTAINGWEKQNKDRFYVADSVQNEAENCIQAILHVF